MSGQKREIDERSAPMNISDVIAVWIFFAVASFTVRLILLHGDTSWKAEILWALAALGAAFTLYFANVSLR